MRLLQLRDVLLSSLQQQPNLSYTSKVSYMLGGYESPFIGVDVSQVCMAATSARFGFWSVIRNFRNVRIPHGRLRGRAFLSV